jgi:hypothetical protein
MARAKTSCVICRKPATAKKPAFEDTMHFDCRECGEFQVSGTFMSDARKLSATVRRQALQRAITRAQYGTLPMVTTYDVP